MPKLIKNLAVVDDRWTVVKEATDTAILAALPGRDLIVPFRLWKLYPKDLGEHSGRIAIWLNSDEDVADIGNSLHEMSLIALNFPVFSDGRSYSNARELRESLQYKGEIRAIGDVLRDQIYYMHRCGIDAFSLRADQDIDECLRAFGDFRTGYQASIDEPLPLFRRRLVG